MHDEAEAVLTRFLTGLRETLPLTALWAHGSLAMGDFQPGRSDLDMVAVVAADVTEGRRPQLKRLHAGLAAEFPAALKLHCSYVPGAALADPAVRHPTWAHNRFLTRPVTAVSRRELTTGDLALFGPPPTELLPAVTDEELRAFVRADLREFWLPATARPVRWLQDIWVDLGLLTVARASVTLDDGRLITKGEALDVLGTLGAPPAVVADARARRYGSETARPSRRRLRRAEQARRFVRTSIRGVLAAG